MVVFTSFYAFSQSKWSVGLGLRTDIGTSYVYGKNVYHKWSPELSVERFLWHDKVATSLVFTVGSQSVEAENANFFWIAEGLEEDYQLKNRLFSLGFNVSSSFQSKIQLQAGLRILYGTPTRWRYSVFKAIEQSYDLRTLTTVGMADFPVRATLRGGSPQHLAGWQASTGIKYSLTSHWFFRGLFHFGKMEQSLLTNFFFAPSRHEKIRIFGNSLSIGLGYEW